MNSFVIYGILIPILIVVLLIQSTWVFIDARKKKIKYYWFWGLICLFNTPTNLLIYLLVRKLSYKKTKS
jgi:hypothetical protein